MSRWRFEKSFPWMFLAASLFIVACAPGQAKAKVGSGAEGASPSFSEAADAKKADDLGFAQFSSSGWKTDFSRHTVRLGEISSGGPPKDGIPPVDRPKFETTAEADKWLKDNEPVGYLNMNGEAKAYPLQILIWHEIANDTVGGVPVSMTFCPLCNTVLAFDRRLDGMVLDFGTTGNLRFSDLVMYDRQTETWWQQASGEAIVGELTGKELTFLPAGVISWGQFKESFPNGKVLSKNTGFDRNYGRNPYAGYDTEGDPFLFKGKLDGRLPAMERVVTLSIKGKDVAYPFSHLEKKGVINGTIDGTPVVIFHKSGTASALDASSIAASRDIGSGVAFNTVVDGKPLTFKAQGEHFVDGATGSRWNVTGKAVSGTLQGSQLTPMVHGNHFWFAWAAFKPDTEVREP